MTERPPDVEKRPGQRVVAIDLLRLAATFQMVQGHTIDAILQTELRNGLVFSAWTWIRGLTSVAFLFAAGLSFHLATLLRFEAHRNDPKAQRKRIRRGLLLIALGYLLHLPVGASSWVEAWTIGSVVDVLQCIGLTLIGLELATRAARRPEQVAWGSALIAPLLLLLTLFTENLSAVGWSVPLVGYVTKATGSIFPIVPWAAHMLAGVAVGIFCWPKGGRTPARKSMSRLLLVGATLLLIGLAGGDMLPALLPCIPLGTVILATAAIAYVSHDLPRLRRSLARLAGESLAIYVFHILIVYGAVLGLSTQLGPTQGVWPSIAWAALLLALSAIAGLGWSVLKERNAGRSRQCPTASSPLGEPPARTPRTS